MIYTNEERLEILPINKFVTSGKIEAIVIKKNNKENIVGVYCPKLMGGNAAKGPSEYKEISDLNKLANTKQKNIGKDTVFSKNYFYALPITGSNQTAPIYSVGERVFIEFYENDINSCFVLPYGLFETNKRNTDKINLFVPSSKEKDNLNEDNTYRISMDSEDDKKIIIQTSKSNGEKYVYTILLDSNNNSISINDGTRKIMLISDEDMVTLQNESGSLLTIKKDEIHFEAKKIKMHAIDELDIKTPKFNINSEETILNGNNLKINLEENLNNKSSSINMESDTMKIKNSSTDINSDKVVSKSPIFGIDGALTASDSFHIGTSAGQSALPTHLGGTSSGWDLSGAGSFPVALAPILQQILTILAAGVDAAGSAGPAIVPPSMSVTIGPMLQQLASQKTRG